MMFIVKRAAEVLPEIFYHFKTAECSFYAFKLYPAKMIFLVTFNLASCSGLLYGDNSFE